MLHDFSGSTDTPRLDSNGISCTGIGGFMDYAGDPTIWTTCSVEDFTAYYNSIVSEPPYTFCLKPNGLPPSLPPEGFM